MSKNTTIKVRAATNEKLSALKKITNISKLALVDKGIDLMIQSVKNTKSVRVKASK
jgi:hypothetical protein